MLKNLRLLKIYSDHEFASMGKHSKVKLSKDFEFPSYELRYLYWQGYPLESLPSSFYAEDLVELDMCYSSLKQLWESDMVWLLIIYSSLLLLISKVHESLYSEAIIIIFCYSFLKS